MAITQQEVDLLGEYIGPGLVYVNVTKPADGALMTHTAGVPAGGTWVGFTEGDTVVDYKPEVKGIQPNESLGEVAFRTHKEEATIKFTCLEPTYDKIKLAFQNAQTGTVPGTPGTIPTRNWVKVGGLYRVTPMCIAIVSSLISDNTLFEWICAYNVVAVGGFKYTYRGQENRKVEVSLRVVHDLTRTAGDQLKQLIQETAA